MSARGTQRPIYPARPFLRRPGPPGARRGQAALPGPRRARGVPEHKARRGRGRAHKGAAPARAAASTCTQWPGGRARGRRSPQAPPRPAPPSRSRHTTPPARAALRPRRGLVPRPLRGPAGASRGRRRGPGGGREPRQASRSRRPSRSPRRSPVGAGQGGTR